jgi:hypothetical protein
MPQCIDLTGPKSVARQTLATMTASGKAAVESAIGKTLKRHINKAVKSTILDVAHQAHLAEPNCRHLTRSVDKAETMVHRLKPTLSELLGTNQYLTSPPLLN